MPSDIADHGRARLFDVGVLDCVMDGSAETSVYALLCSYNSKMAFRPLDHEYSVPLG